MKFDPHPGLENLELQHFMDGNGLDPKNVNLTDLFIASLKHGTLQKKTVVLHLIIGHLITRFMNTRWNPRTRMQARIRKQTPKHFLALL